MKVKLGRLIVIAVVFLLVFGLSSTDKIAWAADPAVTCPKTGTILSSSTFTFKWSEGNEVAEYWLGVGTSQEKIDGTVSWGDIYNQKTGTKTSATVTGIPINGNKLFVRLWWKKGDDWFHTDYIYQTQATPDPEVMSLLINTKDYNNNLNDTICAITTEKTIIVGAPAVVTSDLTIDDNITLQVQNGGVITVEPGVTLTIHGSIVAGRYKIFGNIACGDGILTSGKGNIVKAKVHEVYPEWFGAKSGDWNIQFDSSDAIQAAIDWQVGKVQLAVGTYRIDKTLIVWGRGMELSGAGVEQTIIRSTNTDSSSNPMIQWGSTGEKRSHFESYHSRITNVELWGNHSIDGIIVGGGDPVPTTVTGQIRNVYVFGCRNGLVIHNGQGILYDSLQISDCSQNGIYAPQESNRDGSEQFIGTNQKFIHCRIIHNNGVGVFMQAGRGFSFDGCVFERNGLEGVKIFSKFRQNENPWVKSISFDSCWFECNLRKFPDLDFDVEKFEDPLKAKKLHDVIIDDNYDIPFKPLKFEHLKEDNKTRETIEWLNKLLRVSDFYGIFISKKPLNFKFSNNDINDLVNKTEGYRSINFSQLSCGRDIDIKMLNRLILEEVYPQETPKYLDFYNEKEHKGNVTIGDSLKKDQTPVQNISFRNNFYSMFTEKKYSNKHNIVINDVQFLRIDGDSLNGSKKTNQDIDIYIKNSATGFVTGIPLEAFSTDQSSKGLSFLRH